MTGHELIAITRELTKDETAPYLWSDAEILRYIQRGERLMCKETHVLIDTAVTFSTVVDTTTYTLDDTVLRVYAVRVAANTYPLGRLRSRAYGIHMQDTVGEPSVFSTELGSKKITLYPAADVVYPMEAICAVMPTNAVANGVDSELPDEHQEELATYAAYRCLITNDVDGERVGTANEYKDEWGVYLRDLKREIYRYRTGEMLILQNWTGGHNGGASNIRVGT